VKPPRLIFGRTGAGPGEFNYPRAALLTPDGLLFTVDKGGGRVQCLQTDGAFVRDWRMPDTSAGRPTGLGLAPDGRLFIADTHYARIMIFDQQGHHLGAFGEWGEGPGQFHLPTDVAIDTDGTIYVSEYGGDDRISKFSPDQRWLLSFGGQDAGEARLSRPQTILIAPDHTLWVADACNHRICRFDADGRLLASFGRLGAGRGELRFPYSLDLLSDGTLIVCEYGNNRLQRFTPDGRSLGTWGTPGRDAGQLAYPWAVSIGPDDGVFVIDSGNNRVQVIDGRDAANWR
jgi:DNA-binding beta-propeller fold protein YncE